MHHAGFVRHTQGPADRNQSAYQGRGGLAAAALQASAGQEFHHQVGPDTAGPKRKDLDQPRMRQAREHIAFTEESADQVRVAMNLRAQQFHGAERSGPEAVLAPEDQGHAAFAKGIQQAHASNLRR